MSVKCIGGVNKEATSDDSEEAVYWLTQMMNR